ncbi:hypothetical protein GR925_29100 [Streptomyces sp. HUCO-GS316]|uniref:hypothetical protein n=1 Tax=Streptomyces sp. HUCO-GS316 TaxID=2692198 RepID=UPI00136D39C2|nr:hypothetical protein [Streptomyces sp. HUCO-GS316]MXM67379.1 hypothetical protein [Streptomyces sp. HUCO-GS316]
MAAAAALVALAGCGTTREGTGVDSAGGTATSSASTSASVSPPPPLRRIGVDLQKVEDVACATWAPSPSASGREDTAPPDSAGPVDRPPNYADNNAYRRELPLKGVAVCRGRVHVDRLTEGLKDVSADKTEVDTALARLGYGSREVAQLETVGETVQFVLGLDGVCVDATLPLSQVNHIEAHGPYLEGGCVEPAYGH